MKSFLTLLYNNKSNLHVVDAAWIMLNRIKCVHNE